MKENKLYFDFIIVGGGIQGCAAAFFLSQRKQKVALIEKDIIGRHASGVNAGGVRTLGRDISEIPLSLASMEWWNEIEKLLDIEKSFFKSRYIKVAKSHEDQIEAQERISNLNKKGFIHEEWINKNTLRKLLPNISNRFCGNRVHDRSWFRDWLWNRFWFWQSICNPIGGFV